MHNYANELYDIKHYLWPWSCRHGPSAPSASLGSSGWTSGYEKRFLSWIFHINMWYSITNMAVVRDTKYTDFKPTVPPQLYFKKQIWRLIRGQERYSLQIFGCFNVKDRTLRFKRKPRQWKGVGWGWGIINNAWERQANWDKQALNYVSWRFQHHMILCLSLQLNVLGRRMW